MTSTLRLFATRQYPIHPTTVWYLSDLGEYRGKQELYTRQSPQRLKALREHALIESAVSSNRIEGVSVEPSRVRDVLISPHPLFRDRDEEYSEDAIQQAADKALYRAKRNGRNQVQAEKRRDPSRAPRQAAAV